MTERECWAKAATAVEAIGWHNVHQADGRLRGILQARLADGCPVAAQILHETLAGAVWADLADVGVVELGMATPVNALADCLESAGLERGEDGWRPKREVGLVLLEDGAAT